MEGNQAQERRGLPQLQILKGTSSPSPNSAENLPRTSTNKEGDSLSGQALLCQHPLQDLISTTPSLYFSLSFNHKLPFHFELFHFY